jgi:hypothetical protein
LKIRLIYLASVVLFFFVSEAVSFGEEPTWVTFEKGKESFRKKEYGEALSYFKQAIASKKNYPEAEIAVGDVYAVSSEYKLAESQYRKALKLKSFFEYPERTYIVLYRLADLYERMKNNKALEETLLAIIGEDPSYYKNVYAKYKDVFYRVFTNQGPDRLLVLYRIPNSQFTLKAHLELGTYYYRHGRFEQSVSNSLIALVGMVTDALIEYKGENPIYQLKTLDGFLRDVLAREDLREFLVDRSDIYEVLYYLGNAMYALGKFDFAKKMWQLVAGSQYTPTYSARAKNQLTSPVIEEYVDLNPATIDFIWNY